MLCALAPQSEPPLGTTPALISPSEQKNKICKESLKSGSLCFVNTIMRWYGDPGGDIGIWHEAEENGFERYEDYIDGYLRNWYVYVPESVKESGKKVSVLYYKAMFL